GYSSESVVVPIKNKEKFIQTLNPQQQNTLLKKGKMERDGKLITLTQTTCVMSNIDWKLNSFREEARLIFEENKWELPNNYNYFSPYEDTETTEEEMMRQMFEEYNNEIREDNEGEFYEDNVVSQQELKQIKLEKKFQRVLDSLKTIKKSAIIR